MAYIYILLFHSTFRCSEQPSKVCCRTLYEQLKEQWDTFPHSLPRHGVPSFTKYTLINFAKDSQTNESLLDQ